MADDLRARMAATHAPERQFADYDAMLADPDLEAVIIATSDAFHVPAAGAVRCVFNDIYYSNNRGAVEVRVAPESSAPSSAAGKAASVR